MVTAIDELPLVASRIARQGRRFDVPATEALLLALNLFGLRTPLGARVRLQLSVPVDAVARTVVVAAGRPDSPFTLSDEGALCLADRQVGTAVRTDVDDAVSGYVRCWRGGRWRAATVNPAARSRCTGCVFCPTSLEPPADPVLSTEDELHVLLDGLERQLPVGGSLRDLEELTVSTACYRTEGAALEAMVMLRKVLRSRRMDARIVLLSSVLRSRDAFRFLAENVAPFGVFLTAECVSRRDLLLKNTKADLLPERMPALLAEARAAGLETSFTYIVGLDSMRDMESFLRSMLPRVTIFPSIQVFQPHTPLMGQVGTPEASDLSYFLRARRLIEGIMAEVGSGLVPEPWRCYRSLWYDNYAGRALTGSRR